MLRIQPLPAPIGILFTTRIGLKLRHGAAPGVRHLFVGTCNVLPTVDEQLVRFDVESFCKFLDIVD